MNMKTLPEMSKEDKLNMAIDLRLTEQWGMVLDKDPPNLELIGSIMRMCYAKGYTDALTEPESAMLLKELPEYSIRNRRR